MSSIICRRLRAPDADGTALIDPPPEAVLSLIDENRSRASRWDERSGVPFSKWRRLARTDLGQICEPQARISPDYFRALRSLTPAQIESRPFVLSGHQPELFHAGVWFKNFLLSAI